ncbi:MAG: BamA/TamA family outer membrane protein, partial [Rhizobiaceae bacterium]|nr:BamA/TamA family outer membrane protein [Rhizobiaceae bacterium]
RWQLNKGQNALINQIKTVQKNRSTSYSYVFANLQRAKPIANGIQLITEITGQYANETLPSTEVLSIGGVDTVRGYETSETSGDKGIVVRSELHFDVTPEDNETFTAIDLFAFFDAAHVADIAKNTHADFASIGLGVNAALGDHVSFNSSLGIALKDGVTTQTGDVGLHFNLNTRF